MHQLSIPPSLESDESFFYVQAFQRGNLSLCLTITRLPNLKKPSASKSITNSIQTSNATRMAVDAALAGGGPSPLALAATSSMGAGVLQTTGADSSILDSLRQKVALNELMKAAALKATLANRSAAPNVSPVNESVDEGGDVRSARGAGAGPSTLSTGPSSALPTLSALQLSALARGNNFNALSSSLTLGDRLLLQQQQQQQQLRNELLLASMGRSNNIPAGLLAPNNLNSASTAFLAAQQGRVNPNNAAAASSLLGQLSHNESLLSNVGSIGAMDETSKNLIHHTQIMSGALNDLMKRQKLLETLEANLNVGQVPYLGEAQNRFRSF